MKDKFEGKTNFKSIIRSKDMSEDMFREIERLAKDSIENPKEKFRDEMVNRIFNLNRK